MDMKVITLSGWGQPHDALAAIAPGAAHIDYAHYQSVETALAHIAGQAKGHELVIGWSLGGQLLVRAVAAGMFRPKKLVLIATPYQFVATHKNRLGMKRDLYDKFRDNVSRNPERAMRKAWELIHKGDTNDLYVRAQLERQDKKKLLEKNWLHWLDLLDGFGFDEARLAGFPPTLLIHGDRDVVVAPEQSRHFADAISQAKLAIIEGAGHAPHWHDTAAVKALIREHADG